MKKLSKLLILILVITGCHESIIDSTNPLVDAEVFADFEHLNESDIYVFSEILYKSLKSKKELREFFKVEALRKFDNDTDIVLAMHLNKNIGDDSFLDLLKSFNTQNLDIEKFLMDNPLLTVYIPDLPNGFNAESWEYAGEIPSIAFSFNGNWYLNSDEGLSFIEKDLIPGFPTIVLKNNERIELANSFEEPSFKIGGISYSFIDDAFNGQITTNGEKMSMNQLIWSTIFDQKITEVRNVGDVWQRDYVYFGITQNQSNGLIDRAFRERLYTIKFNSSSGYYKISQDYTGANGVIKDQKIRDAETITGWTDGIFEFRVSLVPNNLASTPSNAIYAFFQAKGSDLFNVTYTSHRKGFPCLRNCTYYKISTITPKEFYIPYISFFPVWDVVQYGVEWRLFFEEVDSNIYVETSETNSIKKVVNAEFSLSFGDIVKFGPKYGASVETSQSVTNKRTFNQTNNELGNTNIYWYDPFVLSTEYNPLSQTTAINPLRYNTGWLQFTFLPNRAF